MKKHRRPLSEDEIFERGLQMADALDRMLASGAITARQYSEALLDLGKWAQSKRALLES